MLRHLALVRSEVSEEHRFLEKPHGVTSQKTAFFIVTAVKTSNLSNSKKYNKILGHVNFTIMRYFFNNVDIPLEPRQKQRLWLTDEERWMNCNILNKEFNRNPFNIFWDDICGKTVGSTRRFMKAKHIWYVSPRTQNNTRWNNSIIDLYVQTCSESEPDIRIVLLEAIQIL
jgi:hypothetical protein